jgi:excisionase family DNA binding protein
MTELAARRPVGGMPVRVAAGIARPSGGGPTACMPTGRPSPASTGGSSPGLRGGSASAPGSTRIRDSGSVRRRPAATRNTPGGGRMRDQASPRAPAAHIDSRALLPGVLEAVVQVLAAALAPGAQPAQAADQAGDRPLLAVEETAELLGVSRMTVTRMVDEGRLPSVIVRRGRVQKTRRIPRAFVDRMLADACAGAHVDMEEYATEWLVEHADVPGPRRESVHQDSDARKGEVGR